MESHTETSGYLACGDTECIGGAVRKLFEAEGMRVIDKLPFVIHGGPALQCNYWSIAIIPGVPGWHLLLTSPLELLCERTRGGVSRFVALCEELKVPGMLRQVNEADEDLDEIGRVTLEADGMGRVALCGGVVREAEGFEQKDPMLWNGYAIPQENPQTQTVFIHDYLPSDTGADEDDFYSNIAEERHSRAYARRLAGPEALTFWEGGLAWRGCKNFCVNGQQAGNCHIARSDDDRSKESRTQGVVGQPAG